MRMLSRRSMLGWGAAIAATGLGWWHLGRDRWPDPGRIISASRAHDLVAAERLTLIDIRTPDEWRDTGTPRGAYAITMHQDTKAFVSSVRALAAADPARPIALICHSGYRSSLMRAELEHAGLANVVNVAEGMAGGRYGQGWIKSGLPVERKVP